MESVSGVHCKVIYSDQIRRFSFTGTEFSSLHDQIKKVCSIEKEFVLKYKDDEGDLITLSTDSELAFALSCVDSTKILRLCAIPIATPHEDKPWHDDGRGGHCNRGGRGRWGKGGYDGKEMKIEKIEKWIEKLSAIPMEEGDYEKRQERIEKLKLKQQWLRNQSETKGNIRGREKKIQKLTFMIQKLSAVPKDEGNEERRNHRIQNLQRKLDWIQSHPEDYEKNDKMTWREQKIARINCCIQRLENIPEEEGNYERRMIRIENLRQNLAEIQKKDKVKNKHTPLSPEQKEKIRITKEKINQLKETISSKKVTIGSKRREMADADIPKKASLKTDIENLRKEIEACKSELFPLRREICQLHKRN